MTFGINDKTNIIGIGSLLKGQDKDVDIQELEKEIIKGADLGFSQEEADNVAEFNKDMDNLWSIYDDDGDSDGGHQASPYQEHASAQNRVHINSKLEGMAVVDEQLNSITIEQQRKSKVDEVMNTIGKDKDNDINISFMEDKDDDKKILLLEGISHMRATLEGLGYDLSSIPMVTTDNSLHEIRNIHKQLSLKNDRNLYCSCFEELTLSVVYGFEYMFDGQKEIIAGYRPDLTGWSDTVRVKLRRMRPTTNKLVSDVMQDYEFGPITRILLDLIPSMFIYSHHKSLERDNKATNMRYTSALGTLNEKSSNKHNYNT